MPLYEYRCQKCGKVSEILQSLDEKPARICPHCGGKLKKMHSTPAIQFKGTGWYVTDYAGKNRSPPSEGGADKPADKTAEKPAGTPAPKAADSEKASRKK
jgi:putative FmdB family regulatory protein